MDTKTQEVTRRRFTVHEYHCMGEVGILREDDRIELIEGEIVEMAAIGARHLACVNGLTRRGGKVESVALPELTLFVDALIG